MDCKFNTDLGVVTVNDEVIVRVAGYAALDCYGIVGMAESDFFASPAPFLFSHYLLGGAAVASLVVAVIFYVVTSLTLKKRLNLQ